MRVDLGALQAGAIAVIHECGRRAIMKVTSVCVDSCNTLEQYNVTLHGFIIDGDEKVSPTEKIGTRGKIPPMALRKKRVVHNPPATVVLWEDGTKTVVKCDKRDKYDPKYGLALCYMKKALGNTSRALNDVLHEEAKKDD